MCYANNCQNDLARKDKIMTYQKLFNETLSKIRLITGAVLPDNEPLMRSLVKVMYDFSDSLKENNLLKGQDNDNKQTNK